MLPQLQPSSARSAVVWKYCGCGQRRQFGCGPTAGVWLLCQLLLAGSIPGSGGVDSGWRVCHRELSVASVTL